MTPAETRALLRGAERFGVEPPADALHRLARYLETFQIWRRRIRLTSEKDLHAVIERHVVDSFAALPDLPLDGRLIDVGSGAGFPGIILGCVRPDLDLVLIDSRRKRVSFLRAAIRATGLPAARALEVRAEAAGDDPALAGSATAVIARAVALDELLPQAVPLLAPGGCLITMQTRATTARVGRIAEAHALDVLRRREYSLSDGIARSIVVFGRRNLHGLVS